MKAAVMIGLASLAICSAAQPIFAPTNADGTNIDTPKVLAMMAAAEAATLAGDPAAALVSYDELIDRYTASPVPRHREWVEMAMVDKAVILGGLGRHDDELLAYDEVIRRSDDLASVVSSREGAVARVNKAIALSEAKRFAGALALVDDAIRRFGPSADPRTIAQVANAMLWRGSILFDLGRFDEAAAAGDALVGRYGSSDVPELRDAVGAALINKAKALAELGDRDGELRAFDDVLDRFGGTQVPEFRARVATAMTFKAVVLDQQGKTDAAISGYDAAAARFEHDDNPRARVEAARALLNARQADAVRGHWPESERRTARLVTDFAASGDEETVQLVQWGRYNLARAMAMRGDARAAAASLRAMVIDGLPIDCEHLNGDRAFDRVRASATFAQLRLEAACSTGQ